MRIDLDAITDTTSAAHTATRITHHADADAVVLLAFTDDPATARRTTALMSTALVDTRRPVHEALGVSTDAYGSLTCPDPRGCPVDGWPLTDVDASLMRAETTSHGTTIAPTRDKLLPPNASPSALARAGTARVAWASSHSPVGGHDHAVLSTWTAPFTDGRDHDPDLYGRLAAVLSVPAWRDTVIAHVATRGKAIETTATTTRVTTDVFTAMLTTAPGARPLRPTTTGLPAEVSLLLRTATHTTGPAAAHAYATAAVLAWWSGDGATANLATANLATANLATANLATANLATANLATANLATANLAADAATTADPTNTLATLITTVLAAGIAPAWTHSPPADTYRGRHHAGPGHPARRQAAPRSGPPPSAAMPHRRLAHQAPKP